MSKLKIDKQLLDGKLTVMLAGTIDEDADFLPLEGLSQPEIVFDFQQITLLNSCGIREWISFIAKLPAPTRVTYRRCPQIIIEQINMVHGFFREGAVIESFYAPYYCEKCDKESKLLLNTSQVKNRRAPDAACPHCGADGLEFDALEEQYFHFLKNQG
ncbi:MAG: FmdB family zinc ribbon protein [Bacteriovoracia bacterium]